MKHKIVLHYIWIEDHGCFKDFGINLSTKYEFKYDSKEKKLYYEDHHNDYSDHFFDKNIDVTAIVGMNGAGKTTLLKLILDITHGMPLDVKCVFAIERLDIIGENEKPIFAYSYNNGYISRIGIINYSENISSEKAIDIRDIKCVRTIYLTELYDPNRYTESTFINSDDLSFAGVLKYVTTDGEEEKHIENPIIRYNHRLFDQQLDFLFLGKECVEEFKINYPSYLFVSFNYDKEALTKFYIKVKNTGNNQKRKSTAEKIKEEAREFYHEFRGGNKYSYRRNDIKEKCALAVLSNMVSSLRYYESIEDYALKIFNIICDANNRNDSMWDKVTEILEKISEDKYLPLRAQQYLNFMRFFSDFMIEYYNGSNALEIPTYKDSASQNMDLILEFYTSYKKCISVVEFLSFSWHLSSGELLLLNQFGKLTSLFKQENNRMILTESAGSDDKVTNAIIMLDEAEVAYHPEWQRIYFDAMLKFVKKFIADTDTHVQLIIATHSPIILSDIPGQNTVYFIKDDVEGITKSFNGNKKGTFAANIFSLYRNFFFLDETAIGLYAENKLCEIIDEIHDLKNIEKQEIEIRKKEIQKLISCIGDSYIQKKFEMEYQYYVDMVNRKDKSDSLK